MVRILGLDPGSRITGYGVVDAGHQGVRYVASGCIRVGNGDLPGRLLEIHRHVTELVDVYVPGEIAIERVMEKPPVQFAPEIVDTVRAAARGLGYDSIDMLSGAGHDAMNVARVAPAGMIFVPSRAGRSHCEEEFTGLDDIEHGANALLLACARLAGAGPATAGRAL